MPRPVVMCLVLMAAMVSAVAACSSSPAPGASTTGARGTSASDAPGLTAARAAIARMEEVPAWTAPGGPVDIAALRGKRIFVIPITETPAGTAIENAEKQVAALTGVRLTFYLNQGAVSDWVRGMQVAIAQKYNLILLEDAPDPRQLQPQIAAAKAAGIPVLVTHFYDSQMPAPPACQGCAAGVTAIVRAPLTQAASAMADWMIAQSAGHADALIVTVNGLLPIPDMIAAEKATFARDCPACKVKVVSIELTQLGNGPISAVSTALAQDPGIDYINPMFDVLIPGSLAAAQSSGRAPHVTMLSYNGSQFALKDVATASSPVKMDVAEPDGWIGYANMDQAFRLLARMKTVNELTPIRVFNSSNIAQAGADFSGGFGDAYVAGFEKLWGVTG